MSDDVWNRVFAPDGEPSARPDHRRHDNDGRLQPLDGLRAFAVLLVFCVHALTPHYPGGVLGVDLFFVLSGYLITTLLLRERERTGRVAVRRFYLRRALRLWPALIVMVAGTLAGLFVFYHHARSLGYAAAALTYTTDIVDPLRNQGSIFLHTWSLAVEEQFYLLWPVLLLVAARWRRTVPAMLGVVVVSVAGSAAMAAAGVPAKIGLYESPVPHFAELAVGGLLAVYLPRLADRAVFTSAAPAGLVAAGMVAAGVWLTPDWRALYFGAWPLFGLACAVLIGHTVAAPRSRLSRLFASRPAVWLGQRSYGFYLWHYPVIGLLLHKLHSRPEIIAAALAVTLAATQVSWVVVEQPFLRMKDRLRDDESPRRKPPGLTAGSVRV